MKSFLYKITVLILAVLITLSVSACNPFKDREPSLPPPSDAGNASVIKPDNVTSVTVNYASRTQTQNQTEANLISAIDKVFTSVVYISNTVTSESGTKVALGSGVIVDITASGDTGNYCYVYTCYHVVENFTKLEVSIPSVPTFTADGQTKYDYANVDYDKYTFTTDGTSPTVAFVGGDKESDVAVLKLNLDAFTGLTVNKAKISNVADHPYTLGQTVFAIGNPGGYLKGTTTTGGISSINRAVEIKNIGEMCLLQIDTAVSHGSSGGGLFNLYGELVGLVNAGNENYENVGYAIPVTHISPTNNLSPEKDNGFVKIANDLITTAWSSSDGKFNYGYVPGKWKFGINVGKSLQTGYPVISYVEDFSIFKNKLFTSDVIKAISYKNTTVTLTDASAYEEFDIAYKAMRETLSIGDNITITVTRDGETIVQTATLKQYIYRDTGYGLGV